MENFRQLVLNLADAPSVTTAAEAHIYGWLSKFFSEYKTPDHSPYSAMIERAIRELNEKGGSCLESISEFLLKEYSRLPWGHLLLLKHHLDKLCESGDIVVNRGKKYRLRTVNPRSNSCKSQPLSETRSKKLGDEWSKEETEGSVTESDTLGIFEILYGVNSNQKNPEVSEFSETSSIQQTRCRKRPYQKPGDEQRTKQPLKHWRDRLN